MREIIVSKMDAGQRLNKFIMRYLNQAPSSFVYKMLRKKNIVLNGAKAKGEELVCEGDSVKLFLSDETIERFQRDGNQNSDGMTDNKAVTVRSLPNSSAILDVLYEDEDIIAVNKPSGMLSQKAKRDDVSINEWIVAYYNSKGIEGAIAFKPSVCNRLDRNTSGIILAGMSLNGSRYLSKVLRDRTLDKYYYTVVAGDFKEALCETAYIKKNKDSNVSEVISRAEYETVSAAGKLPQDSYDKIEAGFYPISGNGEYTLLKVKLITGKSHQIRAQLARLGYPIIGDNKYGDAVRNRQFRDRYKLRGQLLHAGEVVLSKTIQIIAPFPEIFLRVCEGIGISVPELKK